MTGSVRTRPTAAGAASRTRHAAATTARWSPPGPGAVDEALIRGMVANFCLRHHVPGAIVGLFDTRGPRHTLTVGRLSAELPAGTVGPSSVFSTYSVAKLLNASMLCLLHEAGEVDLDAPVTRHLPGLRLRPGTDPDALTLRHLLSNSSGLVPDRTDHDGLSRNQEDLGREIVAQVRRLPFVAEPGAVFAYSNAGMSLAGHVAERATGLGFAELMRERLLEPLGMERTTYDPAVAMTHPLLQHHVIGADGRPTVAHQPRAGVRHQPAGLCFSTVPDLARLGAAHLRQARRPGEPDPVSGLRGLARAHEPMVDVLVESDLTYGLGTLVTRRGGRRCVGHEGFNPGMWCKLIAVPAHGVGLVWADNRGPELRTERYRVIDRILAQFGVAPVDRRPAAGPELPAAAVTGRYVRVGAAPIEVDPSGPDGIRLTCGGRQARLTRSAPQVWSAPAGPPLEPPWAPHMDSTSLAAGFRIAPASGSVSHLQFNGLPYRRANG
ncbi:serine hydrolase domain-containing protein [Micromonospora sp. NPDC047074]|uniref:serine hydrolase domain-containing protein n=1 Tax=Micromonospora sp. NPDC047074 TaxID=3154339 RepID=UPI0033C22636